MKPPFPIIILFLLALPALADEAAVRRQTLTRMGEKMPWVLYELPEGGGYFAESTNKGRIGSDEGTVKSASRIDLAPFSAEWMPLSGSTFNVFRLSDIAQDLWDRPGPTAFHSFLSTSLQGRIAAVGAGSKVPSAELPTISKLSFLNESLNRQSRGFSFDDVVEPGVSYSHEGTFEERYYRASGAYGLKYFYDPGVPNWWGFCDRLAVANLDRASQKLLDSFSGGFCGPVPFSRADVEDLITFFHRLPDNVTKVGMNRGGITEPDTLSAELLAWEEVAGERPLMPIRFFELLAAHVRPGGSGLIIDESSNPRDSIYGHDGIWNRPVFRHSFFSHSSKVPVGELGLTLLIRYAEEFAAWFAADTSGLVQAKGELRRAALEANVAYDAYLAAEYTRRAKEFHFDPGGHKPESIEYGQAKGAYENSQINFKEKWKRVMSEAKSYRDKLRQLPQVLTVEWERVKVDFPRQRTKGVPTDRLFSRIYSALRLTFEEKRSNFTWDLVDGEYPPDLVIIPPNGTPRNIALLKEAFSHCVSLEQLGAGVHKFETAKSAGATALAIENAKRQCLTPYLDAEAVRSLATSQNAPFSLSAWNAATSHCLARWPTPSKPLKFQALANPMR